MLEARGFVDEIIKKIPFINKTEYLEPRRDIITGEPVERSPNAIYFNPEGGLSFLSLTQGPFMVGKKVDVKDDPVTLEIARLKVSLTEPPKVKENKINLLDYKIDNQSAYDYWLEQVGKTKIQGFTLKEKLHATFNSLPYKKRKEGDETFEGGKERTIKKIFEVYKKQAYGDMLKKYEDVNEAVKAAKIEKYGFLKPMKLGELKEQPKELLPRQ